MLTCCCALAGTEACKKCPRYIGHFGKQEIREIYITPTQKETSYISEIIGPKRGEWIHGKEISREYIGDTCVAIKYEDWHCSSCKMVVKESYKPNWNYCPNCGAKMESDE